MSRLRILLALAVATALATAFAACGGGGGGGGENPQKVVEDATLKGVQSGDVNLLLSVEAKGSEGGDLDVRLSGPFQSEGGNKFPQLDMTAKAEGSIGGQDIDFEGGLVLLPNSAYVNYEGVEYEVDPTTFSYVKSVIKQAQQQAGSEAEAAGANACQEAVGDLKLGDFVEDLSNEGDADVGGTSTTKVSGDLDISGAIDAFVKLAEDPACGAQLGVTGALPSGSELEEAEGEVKKALKTAHAELYVGDDHIVRRLTVQLTIEPPQGSGEGPESVALSLDLTLTGVNEEQTIEAPQGAKPLNDLFLKLGINPIELLGEGGAGGLGGLLEGLGGAAGGGSFEAEGEGGGGGQQAYLECLQGARTPTDLQRCARLLQ